MTALRSTRPCFLAAMACLAVVADRNVDSNATQEDDDASYAKSALGAHFASATFNRSAGEAAPAAAGSKLPAEASANVAVATVAAFEPIKIEDSEKPAKVVQDEDADVVGEAGSGATAKGEVEHSKETSPAREAVRAALKALESDEGRRELAEAAAAAAAALRQEADAPAPAWPEAKRQEQEAPEGEFPDIITMAAELQRGTTAANEARESSGSSGITDRPGPADPTNLDLQMQKLRRVAVESKQSHDAAAAQMTRGQLAHPVEPRSGDVRHRSMPLRHAHGANPTKLASSGTGVSRGSSGAKPASTLELHAGRALAANRSAVQFHASKEVPIVFSAEQAPASAVAPANAAATSINSRASKNHSVVQLAEQEPPLEPPTGESGVVSSQALDEATQLQPQNATEATTEATTELEGSAAGQYMKGLAIGTFIVAGAGALIMGVIVVVKKASGRRVSGAGQQR